MQIYNVNLRGDFLAYSELVKNFEKVRVFLRDFYIYGYKSRTEYDSKSARTYDDERRRIESWLEKYLRSHRDAAGKNVFLSIDSRVIKNNPFYRALKTKSFTDADITLHFYLLDVLHSPEIKLTLSQILDEIILAYATTIHKAQGSEFPIVIIPLLGEHHIMLQRNLIYTAITRSKKICVVVGTKNALSYAVRNSTVDKRNTLLSKRIRSMQKA